MRFRNSKVIISLLLILIIIFYVIAYFDNRLEYKIFLAAGMTISLGLIIFSIFEYYEVNEKGIVHVKKLGFEKKEAVWSEINKIYVMPNKYFKAVVIQYGILYGNFIVINAGVKDYKKLIKIVIDKTKCNPQINVDNNVNELVK